MNTKIIIVFLSICLFVGVTLAKPAKGGKRSCGKRSNPCKDTLAMVKKGLTSDEIKAALLKTAEERSKGQCGYGYGYDDKNDYYGDYYYDEYDYYGDDYKDDYYSDYYGDKNDYYGGDKYSYDDKNDYYEYYDGKDDYKDDYYGDKNDYYGKDKDDYYSDYYGDKNDYYGKDKDDYYSDYYGDKNDYYGKDKDDYYGDKNDYYYSDKGKGKGKGNYFGKSEQKSDPAPVADVVPTVVETPAAMVKRQATEEVPTPAPAQGENQESSIEAAANPPTMTVTVMDVSQLLPILEQFMSVVGITPSASGTRATTESSEEILKKCSKVRAPTFQKLIKAIQEMSSSSA